MKTIKPAKPKTTTKKCERNDNCAVLDDKHEETRKKKNEIKSSQKPLLRRFCVPTCTKQRTCSLHDDARRALHLRTMTSREPCRFVLVTNTRVSTAKMQSTRGDAFFGWRAVATTADKTNLVRRQALHIRQRDCNDFARLVMRLVDRRFQRAGARHAPKHRSRKQLHH